MNSVDDLENSNSTALATRILGRQSTIGSWFGEVCLHCYTLGAIFPTQTVIQ